MNHKVFAIPLNNEKIQKVILPEHTRILEIKDGISNPELHILMQQGDNAYKEYTICITTLYDDPCDLTLFLFSNSYQRYMDQICVYCFYKKGDDKNENIVSNEIPNH
jgi:hypothetical protein